MYVIIMVGDNMEKKKIKKTPSKTIKKKTSASKDTITKTTVKKKNNIKKKKGFTLIELLAVIIILGILMIIAIPSVTSYINDSRKNAYIDTAKEVVSGTRNIVNEGKLGMYDTNVTYYIPAKYVNTENSLKSPYGEFTDTSAYVGVIYDGKGYKYYWISADDAGQGIDEVTPLDKLDTDLIKSDLNPDDIYDIVRTTGIGERKIIKILENGVWDTKTEDAENVIGENGGKPDTYYLYVVEGIIFKVGFTVTPLDEPNTYLLDGIRDNYHYDYSYVLYDNYQDAIKSKTYSIYDSNYDFFLRIKVSNNTIVQTDLGYRLNNQIHYLKGLDSSSYDSNKSLLLNTFGSDKCEVISYEDPNNDRIECFYDGSEEKPGLYITASRTGSLNAFDSRFYDYFSWQCSITDDSSVCLQPF